MIDAGDCQIAFVMIVNGFARVNEENRMAVGAIARLKAFNGVVAF